MARITVEDALRNAGNRFALVILAAKRSRQLLKGSAPLADIRNNREIVAALREIAAGKVTFAHPEYLQALQESFRVPLDHTEFIGDDDDSE
ncbi:MAG: DNA-directed RNA polymerase subunit omega [Syntrophaceae bacterium]|jgi:DNA-directed RNA polymerase subunit omega|nr:DNA-directed RNA polymerase subunit omega [Syntrophaceae bacterium]